MASQAETVELLVRKAKFEPQVALAVAEAIDNAMTDSKLVTVPILDARLAELKTELRSEIAATREDLSSKIAATREDLSSKIAATRESLSTEIVTTRESLAREIAVSNERLLKEIGITNERTRADLARWVLLAMLSSAAIGIGANAITNAIQHAH